MRKRYVYTYYVIELQNGAILNYELETCRPIKSAKDIDNIGEGLILNVIECRKRRMG